MTAKGKPSAIHTKRIPLLVAGRKLKVFQAQFGFYDTVAAALSQASAWRDWGTRQNLFASGAARVTTDEAAVGAATAHPEPPIRRALGSTDPFALEPTSLPKVPDAPKKAAIQTALKAKPTPARPPTDRSKLGAAERVLGQLDGRLKREEADFRREEENLEALPAAAQSANVASRKADKAKVVDARTGHRQAGGETWG